MRIVIPKFLKHTLMVIASVTLVFVISEFFRRKVGDFAGSYPFAESWNFDRSLDSLQISLEDLKKESPHLFCAIDTLWSEKDHTGYWHKMQFCYEDKAINALIGSRGKQSTLTLVSIINNEDFIVKLINRDFNFLANRSETKAFETHVVDALKKRNKLFY